MHFALPEKAPLVGAFLCLSVSVCPPLAADTGCAAPDNLETVHVRQVYDGDTVLLHDGRRVRLLNIDTPELGRQGHADQPFAQAARQALHQLVAQQPLQLQSEQRRRDRYGRVLAHLFLADGRNLSEVLLQRGLGLRASVAPDLARTHCAIVAEQQARQARRGMWQASPVRAVTALQPGAAGFQLLRGRISHLQFTRQALWLELDERLAIRIPIAMTKQPAFKRHALQRGLQVQVAGWLIDRKAGGRRLSAGYKRWLIRLGAPSMLAVVN